MKTNLQKNINPDKISLSKHIIMFLTVFISIDTFMFGTNENSTLTSIGKIMGFVTSGLCCLEYLKVSNISKGQTSKNLQVFLILLFTSIGISFLFDPYRAIGSYLAKLSAIFAAFMIVQSYSEREIWITYDRAMLILSCYAAIVTLIVNIVPPVIDLLPTVYNYTGYSTKSAVFCTVSPQNTWQMNLIFRESGVTIIFVQLALYNLLFNNNIKNNRLFRITLYTLIVILSRSTTGYITVAVLYGAYFLKFSKKSKEVKKLPKSLIFALVIFAVIYLFRNTDLLSLSGEIFSKFGEFSSERNSWDSRWSSITGGIRIWLDSSILFGCGDYYFSSNYQSEIFRITGLIVRDNTNTFFATLAMNGIIVAGIMLYGYWRFAKKGNNYFTALMIFAFFLLIYSGEAMYLNTIFYLVMFMGLNRYKPEDLKE